MTQSDESDSRSVIAMNAESIYELAFLAAGIGSGMVMRQAPKVARPSDEIAEALYCLLEDEFGIPRPPGYTR
jgi:hypothetical protein